ncbi:zinc-binding dehydrogenase [Elioraea sp. Yellowstone]|jgi:threonine dehydrogenase-like Zn-dependent dehydrogenase|uniref:alcohol dehydrogenase catalytic domain-containing protein n=1 Tax=Elioraea sp. Yellowstone TaxID=2592070 RepID=UPI0011525159|nr:alcohol dehydrogenase catalytic domain-containing protein [Elioraea sp. Yellowstone]TQF77404.1 zinc-binding dehydrogenase [Elioraea sp. Yellowstone]
MKALVFLGPDTVMCRDEPDVLARSADEAVVRVHAAGICGSDLHAYHGHDPRRVPPLILGHEAVGRTPDGRRVVVNPLIPCGRCARCAEGRTHLCPERRMLGMQLPGCFAEAVAVPEANLIPVPPHAGDVAAALAEPAACVLHALHLCARALARPVAEARALVIGGGAIGLLAALYLKAWGARGVRLAETAAARRATVVRTDAAEAFDPRAMPPEAGAFDLVFDAVGTAPTRRMASAAAAPGGVLLHIGLQDNDGGFDARRITLQEIAVLGSYCYTRADMVAALAALADGVLGDLAWVEERPLAEGVAAFAELASGRASAPKIVLRPG